MSPIAARPTGAPRAARRAGSTVSSVTAVTGLAARSDSRRGTTITASSPRAAQCLSDGAVPAATADSSTAPCVRRAAFTTGASITAGATDATVAAGCKAQCRIGDATLASGATRGAETAVAAGPPCGRVRAT